MASSMFDDNQTIFSVCPKTRDELKKIIDERYGEATYDETKEDFIEGKATIDLNDIDISNVRSLYGIFANYSHANFLVDDWNTSNVVSMECMCQNYCGELNISKWDTSKVVNFSNAFQLANNIIGIDNLNLKSAIYTRKMFSGYGGKLPENINWNVKNVIDAEEMFSGMRYSINSKFNLNFKNVEKMNGIFSRCEILSNIDNIKSPEYVDLSKIFIGSKLHFKPNKLINRTHKGVFEHAFIL